jgi:hypothetical protein
MKNSGAVCRPLGLLRIFGAAFSSDQLRIAYCRAESHLTPAGNAGYGKRPSPNLAAPPQNAAANGG